MNRIAHISVTVVLILGNFVGDLDARIINLRESLHLAVGDTISAQIVMDSIKAATRVDTMVCDSLVVVEGIDFRNAGIDTVRCELDFEFMTFEEESNFEGTTFQEFVYFMKVLFKKEAYFGRVTFKEETNFWYTTFRRGSGFEEVTFKRGAYFDTITFHEVANFWKATFKSEANFCNSTFQEASFIGVTVVGMSSFRGTKFEKKASFYYATFKGDADFSVVSFKKASFERATFEGASDFVGATFWQVDFDETTFEGEANFRWVTFQEADFGKAKFKSMVYFQNAMFEGKVYLGSIIASNPIFITWRQLKGHIVYNRPSYFFLLRNFKQLGYTDDYDNCFYDFRIQARKHELVWYNPNRWLEWIFLDLTCGYGVKPFRAIVWAFGLMILFSIIYTKKGAIELRVEKQNCNGVKEDGNCCGARRVRGTEFCNQHQNQATWFRRFKNAFYFSVGTFTTVGYGDWHPVGKNRYLAMIEGLVGWLIMALFLVTLGKKWIR